MSWPSDQAVDGPGSIRRQPQQIYSIDFHNLYRPKASLALGMPFVPDSAVMRPEAIRFSLKPRLRTWLLAVALLVPGGGVPGLIGIGMAPSARAAPSDPQPRNSPSPWIRELQDRLDTQPSVVGCHGSLEDPDRTGCQRMEDVIRIAKSVEIDNPPAFVSVISGRIRKIQNAATYNYLAVLLAALSGDRRFVPTLQRLARTEKKRKIRFRYGEAALERLRDGHCSDQTASQPNLGEICRFEDPDFNRLRHYSGDS